MELIGLVLATLIGLSLGLLGAGGSILTVPVFVYVLGFGAKPAIAMSLPVVGATSLVGAISHWRSGHVRLRMALIFGAVAMIGSYTGARLSVFVPAAVQLALLGLVMVAAAVSMLRGAGTGREPAVANQPSAALPRRAVVIAAIGLGIGLLTGIVGIGGGFLIVPALVLLARLPMKDAVGTSLAVIAMNAASGALGYAGQVAVQWSTVVLFTVVAIAGALAGTYLVRFVSQRALRRGFAMLLIAIGVLILYQNRLAFVPSRVTRGPSAPALHLQPRTDSRSHRETSHVAETVL